MIANLALRTCERDWVAEFVDLVCADEELVRAEFDAIVAAGWLAEPPADRGIDCRRERPPAGSRRAAVLDDWLWRPQRDVPEVWAQFRQRSPPDGRGR
jgi:hypothetical protein